MVGSGGAAADGSRRGRGGPPLRRPVVQPWWGVAVIGQGCERASMGIGCRSTELAAVHDEHQLRVDLGHKTVEGRQYSTSPCLPGRSRSVPLADAEHPTDGDRGTTATTARGSSSKWTCCSAPSSSAKASHARGSSISSPSSNQVRMPSSAACTGAVPTHCLPPLSQTCTLHPSRRRGPTPSPSRWPP
jgi:hypothetical protein